MLAKVRACVAKAVCANVKSSLWASSRPIQCRTAHMRNRSVGAENCDCWAAALGRGRQTVQSEKKSQSRPRERRNRRCCCCCRRCCHRPNRSSVVATDIISLSTHALASSLHHLSHPPHHSHGRPFHPPSLPGRFCQLSPTSARHCDNHRPVAKVAADSQHTPSLRIARSTHTHTRARTLARPCHFATRAALAHYSSSHLAAPATLRPTLLTCHAPPFCAVVFHSRLPEATPRRLPPSELPASSMVLPVRF